MLLVDDEVEFVTTLAERLRLRGIETATASDGEQALRCLEQDPPQIVILDMMMPGMSGMEVLRRIKMDHPATPVILLTGQGSTKSGIEGMQRGAYDFLMKPVKIEEFLEKIREALDQAGRAQTPQKE